jgi:hypothetical protein
MHQVDRIYHIFNNCAIPHNKNPALLCINLLFQVYSNPDISLVLQTFLVSDGSFYLFWPMQLVTFLEDAIYPSTTFVWRNHRYTGCFAPAATARFLKPDHLLVFLTSQAQERVFAAFQAELPPGIPVHCLLIPPGASQEELWQIAQQVTRAVAPDSEVAFDISHGPLCFPLVGMLSAIFLRLTRGVALRAILYAAYGVDAEAGAAAASAQTPMFDLNEMFSWMEWLTAVDRFDRTGDASRLTGLVQEERRRLARTARGDQHILTQLGGLGKLAGVLNGISSSLHMIRPHQAMQYIADLPERITSVQPLFEGRPAFLAYSLMSERLLNSYVPLALAEADAASAPRAIVEVERRLVLWYAERERWVEAATLAREWIINWLMLHLGLENFTNLQARQRVENVLNAEAHDFLDARQQRRAYRPLFLRDLPQRDELLQLWLDLTSVRNDINHAGMRQRPGRPDDLTQSIQKCIQTLSDLPLPPFTTGQAENTGVV